MIKILIADDHPYIREGLKKIISKEPGMTVADEASNGQEALNKAWEKDYDVVLLDISMHGMSGLDVLKQLKKQKPKLAILILTMHPEEEYAVRVLKLGAAGYLIKESAPDELIRAIKKVSEGGKYVSSSVAERLAFEIGADYSKPLHAALANREYQVMCMIGKGKTARKIAEELSLSVATVNSYRSRVLEKMKMKKSSEIIYYAVKNNLI